MEKQINERKRLQKEQLKKTARFLLIIPFLIALLIIGIMVYDTSESLFFLCMILEIVACATVIIAVTRVVKEYTPLISDAFIKEVKAQIKKTEGKTEFTTDNGDIVSFDRDALVCNGERIPYNKAEIYITLKLTPKGLSNDVSFSVSIFFEDERADLNLLLDGDALSELEKNGACVENMEDLRYYLENHEEFTEKILKGFSRQAEVCYIPFYLPKSEEEKQALKTMSRRAVILSVLGLVGIIAVYALTLWLFKSKISDTFAFNLGYKLVFTAIVLLLVFVKPKATKLYVKVLFGAFIVLYWSALLFLSQRTMSLVFLLFAIAFVSTGIVEMSLSKIQERGNRMLVFGIVLCVFLLQGMGDITDLSDGLIYVDLIIGAIAFAVSIPIIVAFMKKTQKPTYDTNGKKIGYGILYAFGAFFFATMISFVVIHEANYIFDTSEPTVVTEEIVDLQSDDGDYFAVVELDGERVEISIPSDDYYELAEGDRITFSIYDGAFGFSYCMRE